VSGRIETRPLGAGWDRDETNRWIRYHAEVAAELTRQRTALESALIPITAYITISGVEAYRRYPDLMREIADAMPPEEIGRAGHGVGNQIDNVRMWALANFPNVGRMVLGPVGMLDPDEDLERMAVIMDFWKRAAGAYRFGDGTYQAWDAGGSATPYRAIVDDIVAGCAPVRDEAHRDRVGRFNALMTSFVFLLWFDTRSGFQDSGPYELRDGRTVLLRAFKDFGGSSFFPWASTIADQMPFTDVLAAFVLDGVSLRITDFGTSLTDPDDYLGRAVAFGLFDTSGGRLDPIGDDGLDALATAAKTAQKLLYRMIAGMERRAKIDAGAYVYFTFLRPFAQVAGIDDLLDWTVPRDSTDLYPLLEMIEGSPPDNPDLDPATYYPPVPGRV
jgi:hypothetical protein